ncbi:MAG: phospholipase D family protein [Sedimentisphaerales bacterium]|nr:phospholipase D family protein [Sedimentisphaerales bacterium]
MLEFITDRQIYDQVIVERLPAAKEFVWLATADLKDLYVDKPKRRNMVPLLEVLSDLIDNHVAIRLLHAKEPGPAFRRDFDRYPSLLTGLERILCPRVHFKSVIVDGRFAYSGSANLTGAGMGAKNANRRNFEAGFITTDLELIEPIMEQFDSVWRGEHCPGCRRKEFCADYKDMNG